MDCLGGSEENLLTHTTKQESPLAMIEGGVSSKEGHPNSISSPRKKFVEKSGYFSEASS